MSRWLPQGFPGLTPNTFEVTSPETRRYNCIAWAAGVDHLWWWPIPEDQYYWPEGVPREETESAFRQAYETLGYQICFDGSLQDEIEKIAIFGKTAPDGTVTPTHAALQLESGKWTSKLGTLEDIRHDTEHSVSGPVYGTVIGYMARTRKA